jgi:DNA-binding response OmpR family regulator
MTKCILLVDSDELLRRSLADQLVGKGFAVSQAGSAEAALAHGELPDLALIDGGLGEGAVDTLASGLRERGWNGPVVVLGGSPDAATMAGGVAEQIAKPFRFTMLLERLETHLRACSAQEEIAIGDFRFRPLARLIIDGEGQPLPLTEKEAAILSYLHRAGQRAVPRSELLGEVWGYASAASTHTVETHIYRLRRKLEARSRGGALLRTEEGGYRLAAAE